MNKNTSTRRTKYRPSLSSEQIEHILMLAKQHIITAPTMLQSATSYEIIGILAPFAAKIENLGIKPAYTEQAPKPSTLASLGGPDLGAQANTLSKEQYWQQCYTKFSASPTSCSIVEIEAAKEHKYLHGLMSKEELLAFEQNPTNGGGNS